MDVAEGAAAHVPSQFKAPLVRQVADAAAGDFGRLAAALEDVLLERRAVVLGVGLALAVVVREAAHRTLLNYSLCLSLCVLLTFAHALQSSDSRRVAKVLALS